MSTPQFYFAWVDSDQTTFDPSTMLRMDEDIFSFERKHDEGQVCTLSIVIKNPRIGLLNAGRKLWAWFAYRKANGTVVPLFFGVLVGVPSDMFAELITLKFNARPHDYIERKQATAESLKTRPNYDPVFLDEAHRDDPDAILEGWSKLYHVDPMTHEVTVSDILEGEDGTITFDSSMGFYHSVKVELGECPLDTVQVQADVKWSQRFTGYMPGPSAYIKSYTGGSFQSDWPKPGTSLGGGWFVEASYVDDVLNTSEAVSISISSSNKNTDPDAAKIECNYASSSSSITYTPTPGLTIDSFTLSMGGECDPDGINPNGSVGVNIPFQYKSTGAKALEWNLNCNWNLRYEPKREYSETLIMNVSANLQQTVTSPLVNQHTELMKVSGADVGMPLVNPSAWSDFAGRRVEVAQFISPNTPVTMGGRSYQVCVVAGTAGMVAPIFSDIPGTMVADNGVVWASLGEAPPTVETQWTDSTPIPVGEIIVYEPKEFNDASGKFQPTGQSCFLIAIGGLSVTPPLPSPAPEPTDVLQYLRYPGGDAFVAGETNSKWVDFTYLPTLTSSDQYYINAFPQPVTTSYIRGPGQSSPYNAPIIPAGMTVSDGGVYWLSLGTAPLFLGIPVCGTMERVTARSYFPSDRGLWSVEYLISKARARLRMRSRCVKVSWESPFEDCLTLSCRKNATIEDSRIPGGAATGKIISYTLSCDKEGKMLGQVEIGCSVGFAGSVTAVAGTPEYVTGTGYVQSGYQRYDGGQYALSEEDIAYTPPVFSPYDDGLMFPLQGFPGRMTISGSMDDQAAAIADMMISRGAATSFWGNGNVSSGGTEVMHVQAIIDGITVKGITTAATTSNNDGTAAGASAAAFANADATGNALAALDGQYCAWALEASPVAAEIIIHPVINGPFNGAYAVVTTMLELPKGIDLSAPSSV